MAQIIITIPDIVIPRIRAAFGSPTIPATLADFQARLKTYIQNRVANYEADQTRRNLEQSVANKELEVNQEQW